MAFVESHFSTLHQFVNDSFNVVILFFVCFLLQHGGVYVKRSKKFNENAMKKKLFTQTECGAPVSTRTRAVFASKK